MIEKNNSTGIITSVFSDFLFDLLVGDGIVMSKTWGPFFPFKKWSELDGRNKGWSLRNEHLSVQYSFLNVSLKITVF